MDVAAAPYVGPGLAVASGLASYLIYVSICPRPASVVVLLVSLAGIDLT